MIKGYIKKEKEINGTKLVVEIGKVAKQATSSCLLTYGETTVLAAVVVGDERQDIDFLPLVVDYREKAYAAGKIPGGFTKREGKALPNEILSARLIDRTFRPLFPENFYRDVFIHVWVLSYDKEHDPDVLGITATSIALNLSNIPFEYLVGGVKVLKDPDGNYVFNKTIENKEEAILDIVVSGTEDSIVMVEGEAKEISEEEMIEVFKKSHEVIKELIDFQKEIFREINVEKVELTEIKENEELKQKVFELGYDKIFDILKNKPYLNKKEREAELSKIHFEIKEKLIEEYPEEEKLIERYIKEVDKKAVRDLIFKEKKRPDGRAFDEIRPISCEVGVLARTHGSALFTRGETQALVVTTLGTKFDEQLDINLEGDTPKRYMFHYNFPPFSTGDPRPDKGLSRREIGHGNLAERALKPIIPSEDEFPYTIRIVSDILESNGSSSMASVCGGSLSLYDAGVPVKKHIAGIAMGLMKEGDEYVVLTDIAGMEDHLGDMDFKVAGSRDGITAIQMDIKIKGLSYDILEKALKQAREARFKILNLMENTISKPKELSQYAPKIVILEVDPNKLRFVIGPGGKNLKEIQEKTETTLIIDPLGSVQVVGYNKESIDKAISMIHDLTQDPEIDKIYEGKVTNILDFGVIVEFLNGRIGMVHISELADAYIKNIREIVKIGDKMPVKVIDIEEDTGKIKLSRKQAVEELGIKDELKQKIESLWSQPNRITNTKRVDDNKKL